MAGGTMSGPALATLTATAAAVLGVQAEGFVGVIAGAFCGALVFMLTLQSDPVWAKALYFGIALVGGVLGGGVVAAGIQGFMPDAAQVRVPHGVGALVASSMSVRLLIGLAREPVKALGEFLGGVLRRRGD
ncbi:putative holin [Pseudomonas nitroreducens]|uniref:putative holin n=1 Tax=Pseudomonas nitroreducens TaxID=46680 RepID=UPI0002D9979B|nr:putative holin [Pseudomonas nitroreducens]